MSESFAQLFKESLAQTSMIPGSIISATVVSVKPDYVVVSAGLKSESIISIDQFQDMQGNVEVSEGDSVNVALEAVEDGFGTTKLSRERAKRLEAWVELERAFEKKETVRGVISGRVKGGFTVEVNRIRAFLPGSLVDVRPVRDPDSLEGKEFEFKVIKIDSKRNNIVVSRRSAMEDENNVEREALLEKLREGDQVKGIVKNLTDYGAFIDLGGIDGLLHITDMSWKRIRHPSEILAIGDEIKVVVLRFDRETARVSLGLKQLGEDPWFGINDRYAIGKKLVGKVTNITEYGCFVEIEDGIEGLVHVSEMDWTNKNINPNKVVHLGQEVEVFVLDIDSERRRISLGLKQCSSNPWQEFSEKYKKGDKVVGKIKSITDFGVFIGLDGGIDGLVHLSDISWDENSSEEMIRKLQKGDELSAAIIAIDAERERISLSIKQLEGDPLADFLDKHEKGSKVTATVKEIGDKNMTVQLIDGINGILPVSDKYKIDDSIEAWITGIDRKTYTVQLSLNQKEAVVKKAKTSAKRKPATKTDAASPLKTTIGDLLKAKLEEDGNNNQSEK